MKSKSLIKFLTGAAIAVGATAVISEPSHACSAEDNKPCDVNVEVTCHSEHFAPCPPKNHPTSHPNSIRHHHSRNIFSCEKSDGAPTTFVRTPSGKYPIIKWVSNYFSGAGYTPEVRCNHVSNRFQVFYDNGVLNYITTGIVNNQPVVCVANIYGGPCQGILFTLKRGQDASRVVQQLFDIRTGATGGPLHESGSRVYLDLNQYVENLR
ncbi:MAG: hypothetical protein F6K14_03920 [Symploca sp. SIO2C1]|nr:hypothetical protein [Symploca sp. SIO2C1]